MFPDQVRQLLVPIDSVEPHDQNPNEGDVDAIVESIQVNGFHGVIVAQKSTRKIIVGNHRWYALKQIGAVQAPVMFVDKDDEESVRAMLADNRTSELSHRNPEDLSALLSQLQDTQLGLLGTGYTEVDHLQLLGDLDKLESQSMSDLLSHDPVLNPPAVVHVTGFLNDDGSTEAFHADDINDVLIRLADLGYKARKG